MWIALLALLAQCADYTGDGMKALDAKQYAAAAELFTKAVDEDPKDFNARFQLALAYSLQGKTAEAIPQYQAVLDLKPGLYEAEMNLAISQIDLKNPAAAVAHLRDAVAQKPKEFQPNYYLGRALLDQKQWKEAEPPLAAALALDPKSAAAELGLGEALAHQGRTAEAAPHYRRAADLDGAYRDLLLELAGLYEDQHQAAEAIALYREFPKNPGAQERMGALLIETDHAADAIAPLEFAVAQSPTTANRVALAQAYVETKQLDRATELASKLTAEEPRDFQLRMFSGRLLRDQRKFPEAAAQFTAAAQLKPDQPEPWNELVALLVVAEQYPQALAALDRVRALGAEKPVHFYSRALALDHLHQRKDAVANYNKFLETSQGKNPNEEFLARQRVRILETELGKR